jgi:hypothetical protein
MDKWIDLINLDQDNTKQTLDPSIIYYRQLANPYLLDLKYPQPDSVQAAEGDPLSTE